MKPSARGALSILAVVGIVVLIGLAWVIGQSWRKETRRAVLAQEVRADAEALRNLGRALECGVLAFPGDLFRDILGRFRSECAEPLLVRAFAAEHRLRVVADEFGCRVAPPDLLVSCLKEKGWKWRSKAVKFKTRWQAWAAQERAYYRALSDQGLVPVTVHVPAGADPVWGQEARP